MEKDYILFIDSGIGGISTLSKTITVCSYNFIYYADNLHCPYGSLEKEKIIGLISNIIESLSEKYHFKTVVLACNTATTSAIKRLREIYININFIGTEPAITLAKKLSYNKIICLATPATLKQEKYLSLAKSLSVKIKNIPLEGFARAIEEYLVSRTMRSKLEILKVIFFVKSKIKNFDSVVLGCTHYALIKDLISKYIPLPLLDGNTGVSNIVKKYCLPANRPENNVKIILSDGNKQIKQKYIKILNQILAKDLKV